MKPPAEVEAEIWVATARLPEGKDGCHEALAFADQLVGAQRPSPRIELDAGHTEFCRRSSASGIGIPLSTKYSWTTVARQFLPGQGVGERGKDPW